MISQLLDEPVELNLKALHVMAKFSKPNGFLYTVYHYSYFEKLNLTNLEIDLLREKTSQNELEIEKHFNGLLVEQLKKRRLSYGDAIALEPDIIKHYRSLRDLSDLVIFATALEWIWILGVGQEEFLSIETSSILGVRQHEFDVFIKEFCPEAVEFHKKALKRINP